MQFATPQTIKQPKGGVIIEERKEQDYVLGSNDPKNLGVAISDGHYAKHVERLPWEIQRVSDGDTYGCTAFSDNNIDEILSLAQYNELIDLSDMFVTVGSGTRQGSGNTMHAAADFKRKNGFVYEHEYPYFRTMTLAEFYQKISTSIYDLALPRKDMYEMGYLDVDDTTQKATLNALKISPLKIAIEGYYVFDENNRLKNTGSGYNHAVVLFDYVLNPNGTVLEYWIYCSETSQFLKMRGDYKFVAPMVKTFKKKAYPKLFKKNGEPAIYVKAWDKPLLRSFADGKIAGGDMFKDLYGITHYSQMLIQNVDVLPYPIDSTKYTTI